MYNNINNNQTPMQQQQNQFQQGSSSSSNSNQNRVVVPEARQALDNMKYEIARELGVDYQQAYKGNLSARENGYVGGYMVKRLIEKAEKNMSGQQ